METKQNNNYEAKYGPYIVGFVLSIVLTLGAYYVVAARGSGGAALFSYGTIIAIIMALALVQLIVQAVFFLQLGGEVGPRWKLGAFLATLGFIVIVVGGSIWIMYHLNYNMTPQQINQYMQAQQGGF